jgi:MFS family permease
VHLFFPSCRSNNLRCLSLLSAFYQYSPGFVTGRLIQKYGPILVCASASLLFTIGLVFLFLADSEEDGHIIVWILALSFVGVGWNFGFTGATVWTTVLYKKVPSLKEKVQAANDSTMFLIAGVWIVSVSYIFEAGGGALAGWKTLGKVLAALIALFAVIVVADHWAGSRTLESKGDDSSPEPANFPE